MWGGFGRVGKAGKVGRIRQKVVCYSLEVSQQVYQTASLPMKMYHLPQKGSKTSSNYGFQGRTGC